MRKTGLDPIAAPDCRVLILGSLPGDRSLALQQYYGHPRNQFWALLEQVSGKPLVALAYPERLAQCRALGIGLWDVFASALRRTSLDGDIREAVRNPLDALLATLPDCRAIACNGGRSAAIVHAQLSASGRTIIDLPSSSPAYTRAFGAKLEQWMQLQPLLLAG